MRKVLIVWCIAQCTCYALCGGIFYLAYIMLRDNIPYGALMLLIATFGLLLGGHKLSTSAMATCPKCGHSFEVGKDKKDANTQA